MTPAHGPSPATPALSPMSGQQRFPERFRTGSRDLGPGREGPSSLLVAFGSCWVEAVGRGSQAQGLWVLHISQPGQLWGTDEGAGRAGPAGLKGVGEAGASWLRRLGQPSSLSIFWGR